MALISWAVKCITFHFRWTSVRKNKIRFSLYKMSFSCIKLELPGWFQVFFIIFGHVNKYNTSSKLRVFKHYSTAHSVLTLTIHHFDHNFKRGMSQNYWTQPYISQGTHTVHAHNQNTVCLYMSQINKRNQPLWQDTTLGGIQYIHTNTCITWKVPPKMNILSLFIRNTV